MSKQLDANLALRIVSGSTPLYRLLPFHKTPTVTVTSVIDAQIPADDGMATPFEISLGGVTVFKWLFVLGGPGITFKMADPLTAEALPCDPLAVLSNTAGHDLGAAPIVLYFYSSSTVATYVTVIAAE